jgi:hypothetical protein
MCRDGVRTHADVKLQRCKCEPENDDAPHDLSLPLIDGQIVEPAPAAPPERCPDHLTSRVKDKYKGELNR